MSIEQLLFLLLLVVITLLERLIRAMRARMNDSSAQRAPTVAGSTASPSRPTASPHETGVPASEGRRRELPLPVTPHPPALPQAVRHTAPELLLASQREPRVRREDKRGPAAGLRAGHPERLTRSGAAPRGVIAGGDLRRAIVSIAILGPCRALEPKDASQLG